MNKANTQPGEFKTFLRCPISRDCEVEINIRGEFTQADIDRLINLFQVMSPAWATDSPENKKTDGDVPEAKS